MLLLPPIGSKYKLEVKSTLNTGNFFYTDLNADSVSEVILEGKVNSAGHSNSTQKGLKLTSEFYEILNQINKRPIKHLITDLYTNSSEPSGTRVEVWVPADGFIINIKN
jgi:hypothetical protein